MYMYIMKTNTTISLDSDLISIVRSKKIILSHVFNTYLKNYLKEDNKDRREDEIIKLRAEKEEELAGLKSELEIIESKKPKRTRMHMVAGEMVPV